MSRLRLLLPAVLVLLAGVLLVVLLGGGGAGSYRAAAVFDSAEGIIPGQLVKIAGARVGTITAVKLEPGPRALIEFSLDRRFAPFYAGARCQILPEGLISENYVECSPGSPASGLLARSGSTGLPTVPLAQTSDPVSLQNLLNIFSLPVSQRMAVMINELGIGTAGRGSDLNAILRRANPALTQGDQVLSVLNAQNQQLAASVGQMRGVIGALAANSASVHSFVDQADTVAGTAAQHSAALALGVKRLPALLSALRTGLRPIDRVAVQSRPLLSDLRRSAAGLTSLTSVLPAFTVAGMPAVRALARVTGTGAGELRSASPVVNQLAALSPTAQAILPQLDQLLVGARDSGAIEGLLHLFYSLSTDSAGYDGTSHYVSALIIPFPTCLADAAARGCDHAYNAPGQGAVPINAAASTAGSRAAATRHPAGSRHSAPARGKTAGAAPASAAGTVTSAPSAPVTPTATTPAPLGLLGSLLKYLLR